MRLATLSTWEKFAPCEKFGVFASNFNCFGKWEIGDILIIFIGKEGLVETVIAGNAFHSEEVIWENDLYEWRIPIRIEKKLTGPKGASINRSIKEELCRSVGSNYGYLLRNHTKIDSDIEKAILTAIRNR
jgi:hypothetical protein